MERGHDDTRPESRYSHPDPVTDEALDWFMRLHDQPVEASTRAEYEVWVSRDLRHAEAMEQLEQMHAAPSLRRATAREAKRLGLAPAVQGKTHLARGAKLRRAARAGIAVALLLALGLHQYPAIMLRWQADYLTTTGEVQKLQLPDGSTMTLNTASAVALDFSNGRRNVRLLKGEAFFDVKKDTAHPFVVAAQYGETEVKGTAFSVRAGDVEDAIILERGRLAVSRLADRRDKVELDAGQMVVATATALSAVQPADIGQSLSWLDGRVVFHDRSFASALAELRRYYSGSVIIATRSLNSGVVNGNYRIDDIETAIKTLAEAAGGSVTRFPGGILIL